MGAGIFNQMVRHCPGIRLVAGANRTTAKALDAYNAAGISDVKSVTSASEIEQLIETNGYAVTENYKHVLEADSIDVVVELTGHLEFGAGVIYDAIEHSKDVVKMNAELDATVGLWLKVLADKPVS